MEHPDESEESEVSEFGVFPEDSAGAKVSRANNPSCVLIKSLGETSASSDAGIVMSAFQEVQRIPMGVPDIVLLYRTLVANGNLPSEYEKEFSTLGPVLESAAQRQDRRLRELSNMEASIFLTQYEAREKEEKTPADQFLLAAEMQPRRYMSRLQRSLHAGPTARKDAEEKEKARWVEVLGAMLVHTPAPMGKMLGDKPGTLQLMGAGRLASTLRSRVRAVRRYLNWLALNHDSGYPIELERVTGYFQARQSEPCTRNALRGAHAAVVFMEGVARVVQSAKFTGTQLYAINQREILTNTLPGRFSKQAPRMLIGMLSVLKESIDHERGSLVYHRIYAWWILVQSWRH